MTGMINNQRKGFSLYELIIVTGLFSLVTLVVVTIFMNASNAQRREAVSQKALSDARLVLTVIEQDIKTQYIDYDFYKGYDEYGATQVPVDCSSFGTNPVDNCDLRLPVHVLALVDDFGQKTRYYYDTALEKLLVCKNNPAVDERYCGGSPGGANPASEFTNITPASVSIPYDPLTKKGLQFYIRPISDPGLRGAIGATCGSFGDIQCVCAKDILNAEDPVFGCNRWTSGVCDTSTDQCIIPDAQPTVTMALEIEAGGVIAGRDRVRVPLQLTVTSRRYER